MKRLFLTVVICVCALIISNGCSPAFKSETYNLNDELEAYTALAENGDTLLGVRSINGGNVIIAPSNEWYSASAFLNLIEIVTREATSRYFTLSGNPIGHTALDMVDTIDDDNSLFYHGKSEKYSVFYFPGNDDIIEATQYYIGKRYVCFQTATAFEFRTYDGHLYLSVPDEEFYLLKRTNVTPEEMYVALIKENKVQILSPEGKRLKEMSSNQWKRIMKRGKMILKIGNATLIDIPKSVPI